MSMSFFHHSDFREVSFLLKYLADRRHHTIVVVNLACTAEALPWRAALLDNYSPLSEIVRRVFIRVAAHREKIGAIVPSRAKIPTPVFLPGRSSLHILVNQSLLKPRGEVFSKTTRINEVRLGNRKIETAGLE